MRTVLLALAAALGLASAAEPAPVPLAPAGDDAPEQDIGVGLLESADLRALWDGYGNLRLGDDARWAKDTVLSDGVCDAVFTKGIFVPVLSGGRDGAKARAVGMVFFGEGRVSMRLPDPGDRLAFANHMAQRAGADRTEMCPIAWGSTERFDALFTKAMVLTADRDMQRVLDALDPVGFGEVTRLSEVAAERGLPPELVVTSTRGELAAKTMALNILPNRRRALTRSGMDPQEMLRFDRMLHDRLAVPADQLRLVAEFQTDRRFHVAAGDRDVVGDKSFDQWLSCFRDGIDHADTGLRATAFAHGEDSEGRRRMVRFAGERFPARGPALTPLPPSRVEAVDADVTIDIKPNRGLVTLDATVKSQLSFRATQAGVQHIVLNLPREEALRGQFAVQNLALVGGAPLAFLELDLEDARAFENGRMVEPLNQTPDQVFTSLDDPRRQVSEAIPQPMGDDLELLVVLPRPLAEGEVVSVQLDWKARWPFANWNILYGSSGSAYRPGGSTTGLRTFLPDLVPAMGGTRWDYTVRLTVPPRRLDVALSGQTTREVVDEGGWATTEAAGRGAIHPAVSIGRWVASEAPAAAGLPGVRVHLYPVRKEALGTFGPEVRRVLTFMRRFLPSPALFEIDVVQGEAELPRGALTQPRGLAPAGMVEMRMVTVGDAIGAATAVREQFPYLAQSDLARQIVSQVWGQAVAPASGRDAWVHEALTEAYGYFYVRAALQEKGFEGFEERLETIRRNIEDPKETLYTIGTTNPQTLSLSLTDGGSFALDRPRLFRDYSFYVLARMLRERVGDQAFFRAVDHLARTSLNGQVSTEQLQAAFEQSAAVDLDDFFAYWVRGGYLPRLTAEVRSTPGPGGTATLTGCITSDVPFGRFDLPVVIGDKKLEDGIGGMLRMVDGRAAFEVPGQPADARVHIDPYGLILAYSREVKPVERTTCEAEGLKPAILRVSAPPG